MLDWLFEKRRGAILGIDLGSSSVKIVELTREKERVLLTNYAIAQTKETAVFNIGELRDEEIAKIITDLIKQARISTHRASISLSVEKTFSTVITLPAMPEKELGAAVPYEAQKYVPLPLDEVVLDWNIISVGNGKTSEMAAKGTTDSISPMGGNNNAANEGVSTVQVLLLAVPKDIITRLTKIAALAKLELLALEQEAFSLTRALIGNDKSAYVVVDLGRKTTDLIVVDQGFIKMSHNLDSVSKEIILMELDRIVNIFQMRYNKKVGQCLLAGGRANEKELMEFLMTKLKVPVKVGNPFARVSHDPKTDNFLKELGPQFSVAVGLAMREN
jgi:type IV pilus assembly protein PilM